MTDHVTRSGEVEIGVNFGEVYLSGFPCEDVVFVVGHSNEQIGAQILDSTYDMRVALIKVRVDPTLLYIPCFMCDD